MNAFHGIAGAKNAPSIFMQKVREKFPASFASPHIDDLLGRREVQFSRGYTSSAFFPIIPHTRLTLQCGDTNYSVQQTVEDFTLFCEANGNYQDLHSRRPVIPGILHDFGLQELNEPAFSVTYIGPQICQRLPGITLDFKGGILVEPLSGKVNVFRTLLKDIQFSGDHISCAVENNYQFIVLEMAKRALSEGPNSIEKYHPRFFETGLALYQTGDPSKIGHTFTCSLGIVGMDMVKAVNFTDDNNMFLYRIVPQTLQEIIRQSLAEYNLMMHRIK
jgi:hypothetical protein